MYLIFIYLFFLIPCKGDELPEKDGGQRVCGFQQRHVSHTPTVHFNSLYTCTFMQLADQPITWQYSEILTPATSGTNNHVTVKVAPPEIRRLLHSDEWCELKLLTRTCMFDYHTQFVCVLCARFQSERESGDRNFAIGYYLKEKKVSLGDDYCAEIRKSSRLWVVFRV